MTVEELAARVQNLEDIEAIKRLKARYCGYCDNNYEPDNLASLFVEDATWDGGLFGQCVGREAIRKFFQGAAKMLPFALHYVMNPVIEVEGNTGKGTWYLFQTCTFAENNQAVLGAAKYSEEYVKVDGEWKFKNLKVNSEFWTPYDQGWAKKRFIQDK